LSESVFVEDLLSRGVLKVGEVLEEFGVLLQVEVVGGPVTGVGFRGEVDLFQDLLNFFRDQVFSHDVDRVVRQKRVAQRGIVHHNLEEVVLRF